MKQFFIILIMGFMLATLVGCEETILLQGLDQKNANDVLVVLSKNGIQANKQAVVKQQETTWNILVSGADSPRARELLVLNNLPRQKELGLSGVCKDAGLIPTPKTEKCREMLALKGEIINSLQSIPGVISSDVVINIPDKKEFSDDSQATQRPTASVVIQVGDLVDPEMFTEAKVQQFVANAVTGMDMRDVVVIISRLGQPTTPPLTPPPSSLSSAKNEPEGGSLDGGTEPLEDPDPSLESDTAETVVIAGMEMSPESASRFKLIAAILILFFIILSVLLIAVLLKVAKSRVSKQTALQPLGGAQLANKGSMDPLTQNASQEVSVD